jgi:hypothetical protein
MGSDHRDLVLGAHSSRPPPIHISSENRADAIRWTAGSPPCSAGSGRRRKRAAAYPIGPFDSLNAAKQLIWRGKLVPAGDDTSLLCHRATDFHGNGG